MSRFHSCTSIAVAASLSLLPPAMAQQPLPAGLVLPADAFRSAIHDEPGPGGARTVAAGDDYSVEFGDRIVVRPHDFAANWSWQTRASAVRSVETSAWRYLARRDECTEVWDVRGEGLEQSFVIDAAPAGDFVVRGKIDGALRCVPTPPRAQELAFFDANGVVVVRYGAALAFDRNGRSVAVATGFADGEVSLTVPGWWLEQAAFPVCIDPLIQVGTIGGSATGAPSRPLAEVRIAANGASSGRSVAVALIRRHVNGPGDAYVFVCEADFANPVRIRSALTDDHLAIDVAAVPGGGHWVTAVNRFQAIGWGQWQTAVWWDDFTATVENGGSGRLIGNTNSFSLNGVRVGGVAAGSGSTRALIVEELGFAGGQHVIGTLFDLADPYRDVTVAVEPAGSRAGVWRERPSVSASNGDGWVVAWQETSDPLLGAQVRCARVGPDGTNAGVVTAVAGGAIAATTPVVAGSGGGFALTNERSTAFGGSPVAIDWRSLSWPAGAPAPSIGAARTLTAVVNGNLRNQGLAADSMTGSHWLATFLRTTVDLGGVSTRGGWQRLGGDGIALEAGELPGGDPIVVASAFDAMAQRFPVVAAVDLGAPLHVTALQAAFVEPPAAPTIAYGAGCSVATPTASPPRVGNLAFGVGIEGVPGPDAAAFLVLSLAAGQLPLDPQGMPGCLLLLDAGAGLATQVAITSGGAARIGLPLPSLLAPGLDVFVQWFHVAAGANAADLLGTSALELHIR